MPVPTSGLMDYALSLRPEYHQAILDVIAFYGWKNIIYVYDSHDGKGALSFSFLFFYTRGGNFLPVGKVPSIMTITRSSQCS